LLTGDIQQQWKLLAGRLTQALQNHDLRPVFIGKALCGMQEESETHCTAIVEGPFQAP